MKSRKSMLLVSLMGIALLSSGAVMARGGGGGGMGGQGQYSQTCRKAQMSQFNLQQRQQLQSQGQVQPQVQAQVQSRQQLRDPANCPLAGQACPNYPGRGQFRNPLAQ